MKSYIILVFFAVATLTYGQAPAVLYGKATYKYKFNFPSSVNDTLTGDLYFNSAGESYYKTDLITVTKRTNTNSTEGTTNTKNSQITDSLVVYRDLYKNIHVYHKRAFMVRKLVKDTVHIIKWNLQKETKTIGNFVCNSAVGKVAGRNYKVWYTNQIPISSGPWKLYGLPGLVIEAFDENNLVAFQLVSIKIDDKVLKYYGQEDLIKKALDLKTFSKQAETNLQKVQAQAESMGVKFSFNTVSQGLELEEN
ncbi:GLPGLI family protein [Fibrella forsythiae]|uniref:GLPGLI family protein n=1 Tax=Fibrella forsythiae TaxID=2817061 RepID=A0ABS3JRI6_9BACT|nr:GLPGLI family protein [Fibrella forsythiae]MBO0952635.1 GLPGLI family protein [Fibrella forsythiae]